MSVPCLFWLVSFIFKVSHYLERDPVRPIAPVWDLHGSLIHPSLVLDFKITFRLSLSFFAVFLFSMCPICYNICPIFCNIWPIFCNIWPSPGLLLVLACVSGFVCMYVCGHATACPITNAEEAQAQCSSLFCHQGCSLSCPKIGQSFPQETPDFSTSLLHSPSGLY